MLDQKIEAGPDYDSSTENDEPRAGDLVRHWESATYTASIYSTINENPTCEESDEIQPSAKRKVRNGDVNSANIIEVNYNESITRLTKDSESSNSLLPRTSRCLQISYDRQLDPSESSNFKVHFNVRRRKSFQKLNRFFLISFLQTDSSPRQQCSWSLAEDWNIRHP